MTDYGAYDAHLPCKNPSCASQGRPHPNCHCYAEGGAVSFCSSDRAHAQGCKFFRAGGPVPPPLYAEGGSAPETGLVNAPIQRVPPPDDVPGSLGLAGAHHGLLGLLKNVGHATGHEFEAHDPVIEHANAQREHRKSPGPIPPKRTLGTRLGDKLHDADHEAAAELMQGHPLFGRSPKGDLAKVAARLSGPMMDQAPDAEALRAGSDYLHATLRGRDKLKTQVDRFFKSGGNPIAKPDTKSAEALAAHLEELQENPNELLSVGGKLSHYLPDHGGMLAAHAATAVNYLDSLKPKRQQLGALDTPAPVSKSENTRYLRQLHVAQNPLLVLQYAKDGTIQPQDMATLSTIYPGLHQRLIDEATEKLIEVTAEGKKLTYRERQGLSTLLGQPLDYTQTAAASQAIMKAQGPQQAANQVKGKPKGKATDVEIKQINRVDELSETPLESRQINRNRR